MLPGGRPLEIVCDLSMGDLKSRKILYVFMLWNLRTLFLHVLRPVFSCSGSCVFMFRALCLHLSFQLTCIYLAALLNIFYFFYRFRNFAVHGTWEHLVAWKMVLEDLAVICLQFWGFLKKSSKSRSANNFRKCLDLDPISRKHFFCQPERRLVNVGIEEKTKVNFWAPRQWSVTSFDWP